MAAAGAAAGALLLAGCVTTASAPHPAQLAPGDRYVALGSSFAAGSGFGPTQPGSGRCNRSVANYASLLAERLHLTLDDRSCGGATTAHVIGPWGELPPQIEGVTAATRLVTITIGGNDLGYAGNLIGASCAAGSGMTFGGRTFPCPPVRLPVEADFVRLEANLREIATQVKARAPGARLVFVQYVRLVPDTPCAATALRPDTVAVLRGNGERLAAITARVAAQTGAMLLPTDKLSRHHTACDAVPWSTGLAPGYDVKLGAPWHPTATGHAAIAAALAAKLGG